MASFFEEGIIGETEIDVLQAEHLLSKFILS
jgi:hypothetical protein